MKSLSLKSIVWKEGRHYVAQCLNVDVSSFGSSELSALKNLREALELYMEDNTHPVISRVLYPVIRETSLIRG